MGIGIEFLTRAIEQKRMIGVSTLMLIEFIRLEKKLSWCYEERDHFVRVINEAIRTCNEGDETIAELETKNEEWEASFKLYDDAMRRGTKIWQEATGKEGIWPDAALLVTWLLHQGDHLVKDLAELKIERDNLQGLFGDYEFYPTVDQCVEIWNDLMEERCQLKEDLDLHKKIRSAQADMITYLIKENDQRFSDLQDEHLTLHAELAERNATLDQINTLTKKLEPKIENLARSSDLLVEQNKTLRTENKMLRETLVQREMIWGGWTRRVAEIVVGLLTNAGEKE